MLGASWGELTFVAILLVIVLVAQIAPRIGEAIGSRFQGRQAGPEDQGRPPRA